MWPKPQFPADLVTFTEEILNGKLHFFCSDKYWSSDPNLILCHRKWSTQFNSLQWCTPNADKWRHKYGSQLDFVFFSQPKNRIRFLPVPYKLWSNFISGLFLRQDDCRSCHWRNESSNYCCSMNSNLAVFDIHYFTGNFEYLHSDHGCDLSSWKIKSYRCHFWAEICLFLDKQLWQCP